VLVEDRGAFAFAGSRTREVLYARLPEAKRKTQHARLAEYLGATVGSDPKRGFEIGFHYLIAGDDKQSRAYINRNLEASLLDADMLIESVPDLWALLDQQRRTGASDGDVQFIEGMLVNSGYYLDPTVLDRFGDRVLTVLHSNLGFGLANRLAPWIGSHLALAVGMLTAWVRSLFRKPALASGRNFFTSVLVFFSACAGLHGGGCFRLDRHIHQRLLDALRVAGNLGRLNAFRFLHDVFPVGKNFVAGRFAEVHAGLEEQLLRLPRVPMITAEARHQYEAGCRFYIGRIQLLRLDSSVLESAEKTNLGGRHDQLMALFLRRAFHLYRGDLAAIKRETERFDQMAAKFGSRWGADVMSALEFLPYHLSGDVLGLRRTRHRLERLAAEHPGLATHLAVTRAMYEGHRGRPDLALQMYAELNDRIAPFADGSWAAARGHQAECLNSLGRHREALDLCEGSLSHLTATDREYALAYQQLDREAAVALSGLGRDTEATCRCEDLLAVTAPHGHPLALGLLHWDRARIACSALDQSAFSEHCEAANQIFASLGNPALIGRGKRLIEQERSAGLLGAPSEHYDTTSPMSSGLVNVERAQRALRTAAASVGAQSAHLYAVVCGRASLVAQFGDSDTLAPLGNKLAEAARLLNGEVTDREIESVLSEVRDDPPVGVSILPLVADLDDTRRHLVGLLVLGACEGSATALDLSWLVTEMSDEDVATDVVRLPA